MSVLITKNYKLNKIKIKINIYKIIWHFTKKEILYRIESRSQLHTNIKNNSLSFIKLRPQIRKYVASL